jgi:outer membrane protein insertion porin family
VRDYILTATRADAYITLWDIPVTEGWSFKTVFDIRTQLSLVFNQFDGSYAATTSDLLAIDGVTIARGWDRRTDGRALWDNWVELRIPIVEQYLWWDFYLSGTVMYPSLQGFQNLNIDDFLFSTGGGIRLTIPGLPIGLYFAKRFKFDNGGIQWQAGNTGIGLDFVLSFETSVY